MHTRGNVSQTAWGLPTLIRSDVWLLQVKEQLREVWQRAGYSFDDAALVMRARKTMW